MLPQILIFDPLNPLSVAGFVTGAMGYVVPAGQLEFWLTATVMGILN